MLFMPLFAQTQTKEGKINNRIGVEIGYHAFFGDLIVPDQVRSVKSVDVYESGYFEGYYMGGYENYSCHAINKAYAGIKYEALFFNNKLGVSSGLRFSQLWAQLDHNQKYDAFMWLLHQDEQSSEYVSIRSIQQKSQYVSVPLEIRLFPKKRDYFFKHYIKVGSALNYRFSTKLDIDFQEDAMSKYNGEVGRQILKPCTFSGFIFPAIGFKWGKNKDPWFNLEFQFPGFIIAKRKHAFVEPDVGLGLQFSVQLPLN
jgi:hypothetical protein